MGSSDVHIGGVRGVRPRLPLNENGKNALILGKNTLIVSSYGLNGLIEMQI